MGEKTGKMSAKITGETCTQMKDLDTNHRTCLVCLPICNEQGRTIKVPLLIVCISYEPSLSI